MAQSLVELISLDNPVFTAYAFWSAILALKMIAMAFFTGNVRKQKKVYLNEEDLKLAGEKNAKVSTTDPDVERVRRAHLNDLENIPLFFFVAFLYVLTNPTHFIALNMIRLVAIGRCLFTFFYVVRPTQPARSICFGIALLPTIYMILQVLITFL